MNEKPKLTEEQIKKIKSMNMKELPKNQIREKLDSLVGLSKEEFKQKSKDLIEELMNSREFESYVDQIKLKAASKDKSILDDDRITKNK